MEEPDNLGRRERMTVKNSRGGDDVGTAELEPNSLSGHYKSGGILSVHYTISWAEFSTCTYDKIPLAAA